MTSGWRRTIVRWSAGALGAATATYAAWVAIAWGRYGRPAPPTSEAADPLLDRFMPTYDVAERHQIRVAASAEITLAAAKEMDLNRSRIVRGIFRARELMLGAERDTATRPQGLVALTTSLGWGVLAEEPGREIVMGAVTKPWEANVVFRSLPAADYAAFKDPAYVKIVWTLRADPLGAGGSVFRTETRALATDPLARRRFRRYWSCLSPGIVLIRWMALGPLKMEAEARARAKCSRLAGFRTAPGSHCRNVWAPALAPTARTPERCSSSTAP